MKYSLFVGVLSFLFSFPINAKDKDFSCKSSFKVLINNELLYDSQYNIYMANREGLKNILSNFKDKSLIVLISSSTKCGGTDNAIGYIKDLIKSNYNVKYIFVAGDDLDNYNNIQNFFHDIDSQIIRVVPVAFYSSKGDNRKRSDDLLKDAFPEGKKDVIGTPKFYIFRPSTGELLFHGFRYYKNPYPEDIVRYFLEKI
ncbi:MAG: hypothetical protein EOP52_04015 [Sphingobacteriales bacterium]|nr:MAG: hypothetical protein EOP52_04015 [Sphingobacteriales bacterium]